MVVGIVSFDGYRSTTKVYLSEIKNNIPEEQNELLSIVIWNLH